MVASGTVPVMTAPTPTGSVTPRQSAALQQWISAHVERGWRLESAYGGMAVMVSGAVMKRRIQLIADEVGNLSYAAGAPGMSTPVAKKRPFKPWEIALLGGFALILLTALTIALWPR